MPVDPRQPDDIESELENRLAGEIAKLTNFVSSSFNQTFLNAFSEQLHEFEVKLLAVQLSGWVDYAGGPIDSDDLEQLGLDFTDAGEVSQYQEDQHLDRLGTLIGVSRDPGSPATGKVTIQTASDSTQIPEGLEVATQPDFDGDYTSYFVDADGDGEISEDEGITVTPPAGQTEVEVDVIAADIGTEYNTGAGTVTFFPAPTPGVQGVVNNSSITGGEGRQSNDSYREEIKRGIFSSSGGGTVEGIKGFIRENVTGVNSVLIDEYLNDQPVHVDVIVDGGSDQEVEEAIEDSRPAGIRHDLIRPESQNIGVSADVRGTSVDTDFVEDKIVDYLLSLELEDDFIGDQLIQAIMNADDDIDNILTLNVRIVDVVNEQKEFSSGTTQYSLKAGDLGTIENEEHWYVSGTNVYSLDAHPIDSSDITVTATVGGTETTLTQGTDYTLVDDDGDGGLDAIDFSVGGDNPDSQSAFSVDYGLLYSITDETHTYSDTSDVYALDYVPVDDSGAAITDTSGDQYVLGTDFDIIDDDGDGVLDSVDFSIGGSTPDDAEDFFVDYELRTANINRVEAVVGDNDVVLTEDSETTSGDYDELDSSASGYPDSIDFGVGGDNPDDTTQYSIDYDANVSISEDYFIGIRQKPVPSTDDISVTSYE